MAEVDLDKAIELRARGISIRKAAEKLGVSSSVLHRALRAHGGAVPKASEVAGRLHKEDDDPERAVVNRSSTAFGLWSMKVSTSASPGAR
ncbi:helix-turn-helix domain-containing protein [Sorangium cellulosum]|uniref:helix-turn-helix domain-containing protein n=1 Tax=Sorangium cellulosum TaxID=56 RepID=UPI000CF412BF|nr:helix-turn-helix domain-containing protein [Sorangium cellulosum]